MDTEMECCQSKTILRIGKDRVKELVVGDRTQIHIKGEVVAIRKIDENHYDVEIKDSEVGGIEANMADRELRQIANTDKLIKSIEKNPADIDWDRTKGK